ncbi:nuclear transport factor 2 family protein [Thalassococcus sp. S3]|uniref:YybH family protein n=1 Tax=Thalassococcus sp. S3 TaxID=2017482 RepID=UPI001024641F|nr:nuclear transport factor 2 family protein [Thalassococcus sp. S3]QBF30781.1 DUF4440 domain-containing protein [Thalassococcus sp. S3]
MKATDISEIEELIRQWENAICEGDLQTILADHADDLVMYDVPEPLMIEGLSAYREGWELFFAHNAAGPDRFRVKELKVVAGDTVAFAYGLLKIGGGPNAVCRLTLCFEKIEGKWQFAHEHHSMPIRLT